MKQIKGKIKGSGQNGAAKITGLNGQKVYAVGESCKYFGNREPTDFFLVQPAEEREFVIVWLGPQSFRLVYITITTDALRRVFVHTDPKKIPFTTKKNRFYFFDSNTGYFQVYINNNVYTSDPELKSSENQKVFFVADVSILLKYVLCHIDEDEVFAAAEKTAQEISEAEKTANRIKELEAGLSRRDTALFTFKKYLEGAKYACDMGQSLEKIPENVESTFLDIEKIYSLLFAECALLKAEIKAFEEQAVALNKDYATLTQDAKDARDIYELPFFGLRPFGSKASQLNNAMQKLPKQQKSTITPCHRRNRG
jgi:hypothetical protein